jgi:DNA polymerase-3 subunit delta
VAPELQPVYLISGSDRPKVEETVRRLRGRIGEHAIEHLSAVDATGPDAVAACNAPGLFAIDARAVLVREVERWKAADIAAVRDYLGEPAPATVLALVASNELKAESALVKACRDVGELLTWDVEPKKLPAWVAQRFGDLGASVDRDACRVLVDLVGPNVTELDSEIRKLATWAAGGSVDVTAIELLAAGRAELSGFALTDAWGARDTGAALAASETILDHASSRAGGIAKLVGQFASHVRRVHEARALAAEGVSARDAASRWKRSPYYVRKVFAQSENFTPEELDDAVVAVADLDLAVKGGSKLPPDLELARAVVESTARPPATAATTSD